MFETTLISKQQLTDTIWEFTFSKPLGYDYLAGQATKLLIPNVNDERGDARWLSFASSPNENYLQFITRITDTSSVYKHTLRSLPVETEVYIDQPMGSFAFPLQPRYPIICIASGVGIAPFRSLLLSNSKSNKPHDTKLVIRTRPNTPVPYKTELQHVSQATYIDDTDSLSSQKLMHTVLSYQQSTPHLHYIAGTQNFVDRIQSALQKNNVPDYHIITDPYHGYEKNDSQLL